MIEVGRKSDSETEFHKRLSDDELPLHRTSQHSGMSRCRRPPYGQNDRTDCVSELCSQQNEGQGLPACRIDNGIWTGQAKKSLEPYNKKRAPDSNHIPDVPSIRRQVG